MCRRERQIPRLVLGYVLGPVPPRTVDAGRLISRHRHDHDGVSTRFGGSNSAQDVASGSAEFNLVFAGMVRDVALVGAPSPLGAAAVMPEPYRIWLISRWLPGVAPAQLLLLTGPPLALVYCFDAALLGARLPAVFDAISPTLQALTTAATVLVASPFGLNAACLALLVRSWAVLPVYLVWVRRGCGLIGAAYLRLPLRLLAGAALMAATVYLPIWCLGGTPPKARVRRADFPRRDFLRRLLLRVRAPGATRVPGRVRGAPNLRKCADRRSGLPSPVPIGPGGALLKAFGDFRRIKIPKKRNADLWREPRAAAPWRKSPELPALSGRRQYLSPCSTAVGRPRGR